MQAALDEFAEENGMTINYTGVRSFEGDIGRRSTAATPPDIAMFPQPGRIAGFAAQRRRPAAARRRRRQRQRECGAARGWRSPTSTARSTASRSRPTSSRSCGTCRRASPSTATRCRRRSTTFIALTEQMIADGNTPLCVGIEVRRGDRLAVHRLGRGARAAQRGHRVLQPVDRPRGAVQLARGRRRDASRSIDLWNAERTVYAAGGSIVATAFGADNAQPLVDGDCMMHRQASFFGSFLAERGRRSATARARSTRSTSRPTRASRCSSAANNAAAFRDAPEVWAVMQYLGSAEYANARQTAQAALAARSRRGCQLRLPDGRLNVDPSLFNAARAAVPRDPAERRPGRLRRLRPDADRGRIGHVLVDKATAFVNGEMTAQEAADNIEASWPAGRRLPPRQPRAET